MSTPVLRGRIRKKQLTIRSGKTRVLARSSDGRVIREAMIHDPMENLARAWEQTGQSLRQAMDDHGAMRSSTENRLSKATE